MIEVRETKEVQMILEFVDFLLFPAIEIFVPFLMDLSFPDPNLSIIPRNQ
jgi:hypothetical protein